MNTFYLLVLTISLLIGLLVFVPWRKLKLKKPLDSRFLDPDWNPLEDLLKGGGSAPIDRETVVEWLYETARRGEWELNDGGYKRVEHFSHKDYDMQVTETGGDNLENVFKGMMKGDFGYYSLFTEKEVKKLRNILKENRKQKIRQDSLEQEKRNKERKEAAALEE